MENVIENGNLFLNEDAAEGRVLDFVRGGENRNEEKRDREDASTNNSRVVVIPSHKKNCEQEVFEAASKFIMEKGKSFETISVLCIGTDRSTGDCLGPLVGTCLKKLLIDHKNVKIYGDLKNPAHAKTIDSFVKSIDKDDFIIAVDASLGRSENIGNINVYDGPVFPGSGVNKSIPPVGDVSITGIVNVSGFMEYMVLQSTRLSMVMDLANIISVAILDTIEKIEKMQMENKQKVLNIG